jgi:hypothetical protein
MAQDIGPESKRQYHKNQNQNKTKNQWTADLKGSASAGFLENTGYLPSSILLPAAALFGGERKCLSHAAVLSEELVFALFLISTLSLDLSCFPKMKQS